MAHRNDVQKAVDQVRRNVGDEQRPLRGIDEEQRAVMEIIHGAVWLHRSGVGRGASALLVGPAGSGKAATVRRCLSLLRERAAARGDVAPSDTCAAVWVRGWDVSDSAEVVAAIAQQLFDRAPAPGEDAKSVEALLAAWRARHRNAARVPPVVLVLEDVERVVPLDAQAFLYGVLDLLHRDDLPSFVVLGITSEVDLLERLEKRVRSRFAGGVVAFRGVHSPGVAAAVLRDALTLLPHSAASIDPLFRAAWNARVRSLLAAVDAGDGGREAADDADQREEARSFAAMLRLRVRLSVSARDLLRWLESALLEIEAEVEDAAAQGRTPIAPAARHFAAAAAAAADAAVDAVCDLSPLQVSLLVALMKLEAAGVAPCPFEAALARVRRDLDRYLPMAGIRVAAAEAVCQQLVEMGLVRAVDRLPRAGVAAAAGRDLRLQVAPAQLIAALGRMRDVLPTSIYVWGTSWLE